MLSKQELSLTVESHIFGHVYTSGLVHLPKRWKMMLEMFSFQLLLDYHSFISFNPWP